MTRIIAGFAGSLTLAVPSSGTRPTSDRVREAIFSALDARGVVDGAKVLDLFAGSGALGLEAASRGAVNVTLVDSANAAAAACRRNAAHILKAVPKGRHVDVSVSGLAALPFVRAARTFWDIVFIDPPYGLAGDAVTTLLAELLPRLSPDATVVLERGSRDPEPQLPDGLELDRRKDYGDTTLFWLSPSP